MIELSISHLTPSQHFLLATHISHTHSLCLSSTWDGELRCYNITQQGQFQPQAQTQLGSPALCSTWAGDAAIVAGCADKVLRRWDLASSQVTPVGAHEAPIKEVWGQVGWWAANAAVEKIYRVIQKKNMQTG